MTKIYSFIPCLLDEIGHHYSYHTSLSKVFEMNDWEDIKYIPKSCKIANLSKKWIRKLILYQGSTKKSLWDNFVKPLLNFFPFLQIFKKIKKEKNIKKVCFFEYFALSHLLAVYLAVFFTDPGCLLCFLYRTDLNQVVFEGRVHKILHKLLMKKIGKKNLIFFTDSQLLADQFEKFFQNEFHVLPIPHTNIQKKVGTKKNDKIICWWPGGSTREEKGFESIKKISRLLNNSDNISIVMADSAEKLVSNNHVIFIPANLTRKEYEHWMVFSDLILLPYISNLYRFRTSGIFVEAIIAGSIPVVSKNTWMSHELQKYGLERLAINWDCSNVIEKLKFVCNDITIKESLKIMRKDYEKEHSVHNYALIMKSLIN